MSKKRYVLNSPVLTAYGMFNFMRLTEVEVAEWLANGDWASAVGHPQTAAFMSERLGVEIPYRRQSIGMRPGDEALVLRVMTRLEDGKRMSLYDIQAVPCSFGLMVMLGSV